MTIDTELTFEAAMDNIGSLANRNHDLGIAEYITSEHAGFDFSFSEEYWDVTWTFNIESELTLSLKDVCENQKEKGMGHMLTEVALSGLRSARISTCLDQVIDQYAREVGIGALRSDLFIPNNFQSCTNELLYNAIEHGSNYGKKGDVVLNFYGGKKGALMIIEDPGDYEKLQPVPVEDIERLYSKICGVPFQGIAKTYNDIFRIFQNVEEDLVKTRGLGLPGLTLSKGVIIGSDRTDKFRAMVMYLK
ncbi:hypothetical protein HOC35_01655 [Candidatus Woesearchaeota archaeon]|nr:hypothetical protein [Candidatus Woesearchaeota archaeon]